MTEMSYDKLAEDIASQTVRVSNRDFLLQAARDAVHDLCTDVDPLRVVQVAEIGEVDVGDGRTRKAWEFLHRGFDFGGTPNGMWLGRKPLGQECSVMPWLGPQVQIAPNDDLFWVMAPDNMDSPLCCQYPLVVKRDAPTFPAKLYDRYKNALVAAGMTKMGGFQLDPRRNWQDAYDMEKVKAAHGLSTASHVPAGMNTGPIDPYVEGVI